MRDYRKIKTAIGIELAALAVCAAVLGGYKMWESEKPGHLEPASGGLFMEETESNGNMEEPVTGENTDSGGEKKDYIKWVDFNVTSEAMKQAYQYDVDTYGKEVHLNWIDLLAIVGAKNGGDFKGYKAEDMSGIAEKFLSGESTVEEYTKDMKYFPYYREAYGAVLEGMVGEYKIECAGETQGAAENGNGENQQEQAAAENGNNGDQREQAVEDGASVAENGSREQAAAEPSRQWKSCYGLKAFSPIAKGFPYSDFDDFGVARSYGYRRSHLGHDLMGQVGTPVICVESGRITALGWNQYGGWRIGLESFDGRRYYYYAHLRQNRPYAEGLKVGDIVQAGDVIGYMGRTGYSKKENVNNIDEPHLHFGLQLIFDESQREGIGEIWVSAYELVKFLSANRSEAIRNDETKEWTRACQMQDPAAEEYVHAEQQRQTGQ